MDGSELSVLDKQISELQQQLQESQSQCQRLTSGAPQTLPTHYSHWLLLLVYVELSALNSSLTSEQAKSQLGDLEKEVRTVHNACTLLHVCILSHEEFIGMSCQMLNILFMSTVVVFSHPLHKY